MASSGFTVEVNGYVWEDAPVNAGDELSFDQVVQFAIQNDPTLNGADPKGFFRVGFDGAIGDGGKPANGRFKRGEFTKVAKDGTKFTVVSTQET